MSSHMFDTRTHIKSISTYVTNKIHAVYHNCKAYAIKHETFSRANICHFIGIVLEIGCSLLLTIILGASYLIYSGLFAIWEAFMRYTNRKRTILDKNNNDPYLHRYYVFLKDRDEKFPCNVFVHHFVKSDDENNLHDHPWDYITCILSGGYWEHMFVDSSTLGSVSGGENSGKSLARFWRNPGHIQYKSKDHLHRVQLPCDSKATQSNTWTLFVPLKREKSWGFFESSVESKKEK